MQRTNGTMLACGLGVLKQYLQLANIPKYDSMRYRPCDRISSVNDTYDVYGFNTEQQKTAQ
jgi:hypothetical protein